VIDSNIQFFPKGGENLAPAVLGIDYQKRGGEARREKRERERK
jgi:hypothetical protein